MNRSARLLVWVLGAAIPVALGLGYYGGTETARLSLAARPTQTPVVTVRTRTITKLVPQVVIRTITRTIVATPTPVPSPTAVPTVATDGPQVRIDGATHCTDDNMCVTLIGYSVDTQSGDDGQKSLITWFHVVNNGSKDHFVGQNLFHAGVSGGQVVDASFSCDSQCVSVTLVAGGSANGTASFYVPTTSHSATVRLDSHTYDAPAVGTWDVTY